MFTPRAVPVRELGRCPQAESHSSIQLGQEVGFGCERTRVMRSAVYKTNKELTPLPMLDVQTSAGYEVKDGPQGPRHSWNLPPPPLEDTSGFFWAWHTHINFPPFSCQGNLSPTPSSWLPTTSFLSHHVHHQQVNVFPLCTPTPPQKTQMSHVDQSLPSTL